jgi:anti-anti-sigma regulatory factor
MHMAKTSGPLKIVEEHAIRMLQEAGDKLKRANGEVVLDFSVVARVDSRVLTAMEELAKEADERSAKVVLRGVNVDVYRVLKLVELASRFSFEN